MNILGVRTKESHGYETAEVLRLDDNNNEIVIGYVIIDPSGNESPVCSQAEARARLGAIIKKIEDMKILELETKKVVENIQKVRSSVGLDNDSEPPYGPGF